MASNGFAAKTPGYEGWISLDFLGFSRQNLDLSMSYAGFSLDQISRRFSVALAPPVQRRGAPCGLGLVEGQDCSSGKLNSVSDYLQSIVAEPFPLPSARSRRDAPPEQGDCSIVAPWWQRPFLAVSRAFWTSVEFHIALRIRRSGKNAGQNCRLRLAALFAPPD